MPILEVEMVLLTDEGPPENLSLRLARAASEALNSEPAGTWVRLRTLDESGYAEGHGGPAAGVKPVFVKVLKASLPGEEELRQTAARLATAVAEACGRPSENVHVLFEPPAAGRIWFGGTRGRGG